MWVGVCEWSVPCRARICEAVEVAAVGENVVISGRSMRELDKVLVPDPSNLVVGVVLIFGEPKLTLFSNDIEDL